MCVYLYVCVLFVHVLVQDAGLNASPCTEIYDGMLIKYMAPLDMQDQFFVPEAVMAADDLLATGDAAAAAEDDGDK